MRGREGGSQWLGLQFVGRLGDRFLIQQCLLGFWKRHNVEVRIGHQHLGSVEDAGRERRFFCDFFHRIDREFQFDTDLFFDDLGDFDDPVFGGFDQLSRRRRLRVERICKPCRYAQANHRWDWAAAPGSSHGSARHANGRTHCAGVVIDFQRFGLGGWLVFKFQAHGPVGGRRCATRDFEQLCTVLGHDQRGNVFCGLE